MKILVIGLDCAAPEILLEDQRLVNIRRLMNMGCYGRLESIIPPITVPAWMCMATSQDPGSLGVYGFRNRSDYSYSGLNMVNSKAIQELTIWDQIAREGGRSIIIGVPPTYPPRKMNGICVSCFMTPDPSSSIFTHPASYTQAIQQLVGEYPVDVKGYRTDRKDWLAEKVFAMSRKQFELVRHFLQTEDWDYFQFVDIGLDRIHHGFWNFFDPQHVLYQPGNPYQNVIPDYYLHLDEQIGQVLELLTDDTIILVVSDHGAQRLDGGFCVNEWLVREGLLVLNEYPDQITPFDKLCINWEKTKVWSEGGYYARIFLNIKGREPQGIIDKRDVLNIRDELKARLEALPDEKGRSMGTLVFKPEEIYQRIHNVAPDLIVHFGGLKWRSIGGVGYPRLHIQENDTGPDGCNHAQFGAFILASVNNPLQNEIQGTHILDIAPTLLELGGYDIPNSMQGTSLVSGRNLSAQPDLSEDEKAILRERLSGLGYIS
jgi:predicted AlkP superfamily phosphohydrolase/phosphomutase